MSYANVAATLALFSALSGTAAAAVTLARDSVGAEHIRAGRWLVQAKLAVLGNFAPLGNPCGLVVSDTTLVDQARFVGEAPEDYQTSEQVSLAAVVTTAPDVDSTIVAVRCYTTDDQDVLRADGKLTAIEVKDEAQTE